MNAYGGKPEADRLRRISEGDLHRHDHFVVRTDEPVAPWTGDETHYVGDDCPPDGHRSDPERPDDGE